MVPVSYREKIRVGRSEINIFLNICFMVLAVFCWAIFSRVPTNLVPRACDPWEGNEGSGIIRCRKPGILAKIELRIHFNGQSDSSLKRIIPEPSFPSQGSQARGTRLSPDNRRHFGTLCEQPATTRRK